MNLLTLLKNRQKRIPAQRVPHSFQPALEALEDRFLPSTTAVLVKDINPPSGLTIRSSNPANLTNFNGMLYFTAVDASHGRELWKSDGTDAGTVMVRDIRLGSVGSDPADLTVIGSTLYFTADDGANGRELWKTDGTLTGTRMVNNIRPGALGSAPANLTAAGSTLFFTADNGVTGQELWKSNGSTSGTVQVRDIRPGAIGSAPANLAAMGGNVYLAADDGSHGMELWKSDGTGAGTVLLNINTDVTDSSPAGTDISSSPTNLTAVGSDLYFVADPGEGPIWPNEPTLLRTDGTMAGTSWVDFNYETVMPFSHLTNVNDGKLYYYKRHGDYQELNAVAHGQSYTSDHLHVDGYFGPPPSQLAAVNSTVFFFSVYFFPEFATWELFKHDGTTLTEVVTFYDGGSSSFPSNLTNVNGTLYFTIDDGVHGTELWESDGTAAGTRLVRNINSLSSSFAGNFCNVNGTLYFAANNGFAGTELWKTRPNTAPALSLPQTTYTSVEGLAASVACSATDAEGDTVTFSASGLPAGFTINRSTGVIYGTAAYSAGRLIPYAVTVTASDGNESSSSTFQWLVMDIWAPTIVNPGNQTSNEGNVVSLAIRASDPYGDALTFSAAGLPAGLSINSSTGVISGTLGWQSAGTYSVRVTASDGTNSIGTTFAWTVADLTAPSVTNPGPQRSSRGNTVALAILADDPEGDPLTYTALNLPLGLRIDPRTGLILGTISLAALSRYDVTILVSDGTNTSSVSFTWTVG